MTSSLCSLQWFMIMVLVGLTGSSQAITEFGDYCVSRLSRIPNGRLTMVVYSEIASELSGRQVEAKFQRLPLGLVALFHYHSCLTDETACVSNPDKAYVGTRTRKQVTEACVTLETAMTELNLIPKTQAQAVCSNAVDHQNKTDGICSEEAVRLS